MSQDRIIKIVDEGDVAVVTFLVPSICGTNDVDQTANLLREYLDETKPRAVIVDFAGVKFFSSQVLGLLVDAWKRLSDHGAGLYICGINPQLSRVFKITNLDKIFNFYEDKAAAISALTNI